MNVGKSIAKLRISSGLSQQALADLLFVDRSLVSKWESGDRRPDFGMIGRIAGVFNVDADVIADKNDLIFAELLECVPEGVDLPENELTAATERFLRTLDPRDARIFLKRYYFLKTPKEIGAETGLRPGTVRRILSETRAVYREFLKEAVQ